MLEQVGIGAAIVIVAIERLYNLVNGVKRNGKQGSIAVLIGSIDAQVRALNRYAASNERLADAVDRLIQKGCL